MSEFIAPYVKSSGVVVGLMNGMMDDAIAAINPELERHHMKTFLYRAVPCAALLMAGASGALAQDYPRKSVRLVSPFSAGGGGDAIARYFGAKLANILHQQFVVDSRPGAGNIIATEFAAKSAADGYTILFVNDTHAINAALREKLPYETMKDFAPISLIASTPFVLVVHPSLPVRSVRDLIRLAKARPGEINYSSPGIGTVSNLSLELFKINAKVDLFHVAYRGISSALVDLVAGRVQTMTLSPASALSFANEGKLRALATTGAKRALSFPNLPTFEEAGVQNYEFSSSYGLLAPAGMASAQIAVLNQAVSRMLKEPDVGTWLNTIGAEPVGSTPAEYRNYLEARIRKYEALVRAIKLRTDKPR